MKDKRERQELREVMQLSDGIDKYYRGLDRQGAGDTAPGMGMVFSAMTPIIAKLELDLTMLDEGKTHLSQVPLAVQYMTNLRPDAVAYITAKVCVSAAAGEGKLTRTAMRLVNLIEEDYQFEELEVAEPALARTMSQKAMRWTKSSARRRIMRTAARVAGIAHFGWTETEKLRLGVYLIETFITCTGFGKLTELREGLAVERLDDRRAQCAELLGGPVDLPMLCPPIPWTSPLVGGYLTARCRRPLIRVRQRELLDDLFSCDMPDVYRAVNTLQATRWAVNRPLFDIMREVRGQENRTSLGGLPEDEQPIPERPTWLTKDLAPKDMTEVQLEEFNTWKSSAREAYEYNGVQNSRNLALEIKVAQFDSVVDEEAIWFPHSLDFRGRVYPLTTGMAPQGDDLGKAMLQFAEGKPLGESGGFWLAVHIANLFGEDKQSFDDRVQWVLDNSEWLEDSAKNPLDGYRFWTQADDPWCALAACMEWHGFQRDGPEFLSHLPIHMDGTCSGIQHFSAMLKDEEGGSAVNLRPHDKPSDIYTEVLNVTKDLLAKNPEPLAKVWLDKIDRKIVKRPCMTFAYSVTSAGIRGQIVDEMRKRTNNGQFLSGHDNWKAGQFLAPIVEEAIRSVVKRAAEAMDWLKGVAEQYNDEGIPTSWVTPLGFPVQQPYRKSVGKRLLVWFDGVRLKLTLKVTGTKIDTRKQISSVAPNFVHSMDATHLMMVVNRMADEGVTDSFAMIHDSFGVHACDVDEMQFIIREEFIKLYGEDILVKTYQSTLLAMPGDKWKGVPTPPEAGNLNLEEVRDADFFFA